ncbi:unnamed protein product [Urochloa humidicola]
MGTRWPMELGRRHLAVAATTIFDFVIVGCCYDAVRRGQIKLLLPVIVVVGRMAAVGCPVELGIHPLALVVAATVVVLVAGGYAIELYLLESRDVSLLAPPPDEVLALGRNGVDLPSSSTFASRVPSAAMLMLGLWILLVCYCSSPKLDLFFEVFLF